MEPEHHPRFPELIAFDIHRFREFAADRTIRKGISWYRSGRITRFVESDEGLEVTFDGGARDEPAGNLLLLPPEEPGGQPTVVSPNAGVVWSDEDCQGYAVAAVLAYQATLPVDPAVLADSAERMRLERLDRARQEVALRPVGQADDRHHLLGNFSAHSVGVTRPGRDAYRVQMRSLSYRINGCTCPDFQQGGLGLCKHIGAALLRAQRRPSATPRPTRARIFRELSGEGATRWGVIAPTTLVEHVEAGGLVTAAMRIPVDALPLETTGGARAESARTRAAVTVWRLPAGDDDLALRLVESWSDDPRVDMGSDIMAAVDDVLTRRQRTNRRRRVTRLLDEADGEIPGLHVRPFPYQWEGIRFLVRNGRALLADDMGLGKTMQAIAATTFMRHLGEVERTLIVCPTSLLTQWADELEKFTGERPAVIDGNAGRRKALLRDRPAIAVTTFERARMDFDALHRDYKPDLLIVDEAQRVKNWATRNAQHLAALQTRFAFILTGTPLENRLEELYALMQLVDPSVLGPLWRFSQEFCVTDLAGLPIGYRNLSTLRSRLAPVLLRRTRGEVLKDLPDRTDTDLHIPLAPDQRALHDDLVHQARRIGAIRRRRPLTPAESRRLLALLQKARMVCDAAILVDPRAPAESPKIDTLLELLEELCVHEERKVVVFSEWIGMAELCIPRIRDELGLRVLHLHGGVPGNRRGALIDTFNHDPRARVFFSSDAGGVGLNLQAASALIHLDCPWNPAVLEQRSARVHRHGQANNVQIIRLLAQDAYETHVAALVEDKRSLFDATVSPDAEADTFTLGGKQLDAMLQALATPQERHPAGTWKDASSAVADDDLTGAHLASGGADEDERTYAREDRGEDERASGDGRTTGDGRGREDQFGRQDEHGRGAEHGERGEGGEGGEGGTPARTHVDAPLVERGLATGARELQEQGQRQPGQRERVAQDQAAQDRTAQRPTRPDPGDARLASARALRDAGQPHLALRLMVEAHLDAAAATLGVRLPTADDTWRWIYADALPSGALNSDQANALALGLAVVRMGDAATPDRIDEAWRMIGA